MAKKFHNILSLYNKSSKLELTNTVERKGLIINITPIKAEFKDMKGKPEKGQQVYNNDKKKTFSLDVVEATAVKIHITNMLKGNENKTMSIFHQSGNSNKMFMVNFNDERKAVSLSIKEGDESTSYGFNKSKFGNPADKENPVWIYAEPVVFLSALEQFINSALSSRDSDFFMSDEEKGIESKGNYSNNNSSKNGKDNNSSGNSSKGNSSSNKGGSDGFFDDDGEGF